jgi:hypothetical protein
MAPHGASCGRTSSFIVSPSFKWSVSESGRDGPLGFTVYECHHLHANGYF